MDTTIEQVVDTELSPVPAQPAPADSDIQIEIEDTPEAEKPRLSPNKPFKPYEPEQDTELDDLSEQARKRIKRLTFQWREEERQRLQVQKERDAALEYARAAHGSLTRLQQSSVQHQKTAIQAVTQNTEGELQRAKRELKEAQERADYDAVAELTQKVGELASQKQSLSAIPAPTELPIPPAPEYEAEPQASARARSWAENNKWFSMAGGRGANPMSQYALAVHEQVIEQGIQLDSEAYYEAIDEEMKKRFPDAFGATETPRARTPEPQRRTSTSIVAPAIRTNSAGKTVIKLSASQVAIAKQLGISPEQYARQQMEDANA